MYNSSGKLWDLTQDLGTSFARPVYTKLLGAITPRYAARASGYRAKDSATRKKNRTCVPVNHPTGCLNVLQTSRKRLIIVSIPYE